MTEVMRDGLTEARVALRDWASPHSVAVGAIEGLDGEITIIDGDVWISRVRDGDFVTSWPAVGSDERATLLVASRVQTWRTIALDTTLKGAELEDAIELAAARHAIDTSRPFPFIIDGIVTSLEIHVINGFCPHSSGEAAAGQEPLRISLTESTPATIIGFYAKRAQGVVTHHGTSMHAHVLLQRPEGRVTGHIDSVEITADAILRLPIMLAQ